LSFAGNQYPNFADKVITTRGDIVRGDSSGDRERYGIGAANYVLTSDGNDPTWADPEGLKHAVALEIAASDETTALSASTAAVTFRLPWAMTLNAGIAGVIASLTTAGTGSVVTVDINQNGATILSTKITIDPTEKTSYSAAVPVVIDDTTLDFNAEMTVDIDGVDSGGVAAGLKIMLIGDLT